MVSELATTLAVLSDIHGNARALDAVLADIDRRRITDIVNLGDCAYGPFDSSLVLNTLMERCISTVSGNEDRVLVEVSQGGAHSRTAIFSTKWLGSRHLEWLAQLPMQMTIGDVTGFHGVPGNDTTYLLTVVGATGIHPRSREEITSFVSGITGRILLCGHDHMPHELTLDSGQIIVNPGSVGCPAYTDDVPASHAVENGSPHACYAVIRMLERHIDVESVRVSYDWNAAADEALANGFSDWAHWIRTGCV